MTQAKPTIAFTVDVEDWPQSAWNRSLPIGDYCADNTRRLLELISTVPSARGTFFVLGKFADRHPQVVRAIRDAGHEIGSHGYGHVEVFHLSAEEFREDLQRSVDALGAAAGVRPVGYRAPDFSIVGESLWALGVLAENGFVYDSSVFPISKARYGIADWPRYPTRVRLESGVTITEFPLATVEMLGRRLPVGGGGYARLLPGVVLTRALRAAGRQLHSLPVFYCHPYELDPDEFKRLEMEIPFRVRLHQGMGRKRTAAKLQRLLVNFECITLKQAMARAPALKTIDPQRYRQEYDPARRPPAFEGSTHLSGTSAAPR